MLARNQKEFIELFNSIEDPREDGRVLYPIAEILFLVIAGVLSCAESWREIVCYGNMNIEFLRNYLPFAQGIPSKSVLSRVFGIIDKKIMERFLIDFAAWFQAKSSSITDPQREVIALDGKKIRGSGIHLLHALATQAGIVLCQVDIDNKNNESVKIPEILDTLEVSGAVVTADALNCQKAIAKKIVEKGADYFLALKGNQGTLFEDAKSYFVNKEGLDFIEDINKEHGRLEIRKCWSTSNIDWLKGGHCDWVGLKSICYIERERHIKDKISKEVALYISSTDAIAKNHLYYSRQHWDVENKLHWVLDVIFNEDHSTFMARNAAQNMGIVRKLIINMIRRYKKTTGDQTAIKTVRKASSWSVNATAKVLNFMVAN